MALRVLLADESTTIKKVMQLALQDFAVEVKSVHSGLDVAEVARGFSPDIIFADVLLQKKNGYEVSLEIKQDSSLSRIPLVLMWSSFMDLDEKLAAASGADRRLEKPFDVENLRKIVLELVPKTRSHGLSQFLRFPDNLTAPLKQEIAAQTPPPMAATRSEVSQPAPSISPESPHLSPLVSPAKAPQASDELEKTSAWNVDSFEDLGRELPRESLTNETTTERIQRDGTFGAESTSDRIAPTQTDTDEDQETFSEFRIQPSPFAAQSSPPPLATEEPATTTSSLEDRDPWSHQDLQRFKIDLPPIIAPSQDDEFTVSFPTQESSDAPTEQSYHELEMEGADPIFAKTDLSTDVTLPDSAADGLEIEPVVELEPSLKLGHPEPSGFGSIPGSQLSANELEAIIRSQSREIIEAVVRRIVPDLATQIIREELERLLEDSSVRESPLSHE